MPFLDVARIQGSRQTVGIVGLVGFLLTGIGWVEAMRSSIRAVWQLEQQPGNYFVRQGVDILVLLGLGLLLLASIGFSVGARAGVGWLKDQRGYPRRALRRLFNGLYFAVAVVIDLAVGRGDAGTASPG